MRFALRPGSSKTGLALKRWSDNAYAVNVSPGDYRKLSNMEESILDGAFSVFPREWQNRARDILEKETVWTVRDRGFNGGGEIAISYTGLGSRGFFGTSVHEIAHTMEAIVPGIAQAEDFYWRKRTRTAHGTELGKFSFMASDGGFFPGGRPNAMPNFYSLKRYKIDSIDSPGHFELLSTGLEDLLGTGNIGGYLDDDFEDFLWGVLLWF